MKIIQKWLIKKENVSISACAIDPVFDQMIVGVGKTIYVINVENGEEIKRCDKHTAEVSCLAYRKDGLWFASGGYVTDIIFYRKDNVVYLWDIKNLAKPTNKISFTDPIIQVSYNPCILTVIRYYD